MEKPFIKLFSTVNGYYFFDVNTNTVTPISEDTYLKLNKIVNDENVQGIESEEIENLKDSGLLSGFRASKITHLPQEITSNMLNNYMSTIVLQVTQRCNLRCSYCAYTINTNEVNHRKHTDNDMTWDVAKKAIDFYLLHSRKIKYPNIAFYGGEPLLKFDLIKRIILYSEKKFKGKKVDYRITTNGTLLSDEVVCFFENHNVLLTVSLDGNKSMHDEHRRFAVNGQGSYDVVIKNLKNIKKNHSDYLGKCSINMVLDAQNKFESLNQFFEEDQREIGIESIMTTEIDDLFSEQKNIYSESYLYGREYQYFLKYLEYFGRILPQENSEIVGQMMFQDINTAINFSRMEKMSDNEIVGGCCIPGQLHLLCDYKGDFFPCERVNEKNPLMIIGNVYEGLFYKKIDDLLDFHAENERRCLECWACRNCDLCIRHIGEDGRISFKNGMSRYCMASKRHLEDTIKTKIFLEEIFSIYQRQIGEDYNEKDEKEGNHNLSIL